MSLTPDIVELSSDSYFYSLLFIDGQMPARIAIQGA
jgi:hypothetical protein